MTGHQKLRVFAVVLAIVTGSLPLAFITTIILMPFWRWLEADLGVESIGHSGPLDWCFWTMYGLYMLIFILAWIDSARKKRQVTGD